MLRFAQQHYFNDECILSVQKYSKDVGNEKQLGENYIIAINKYLHNKRTRICIDSCTNVAIQVITWFSIYLFIFVALRL